MKNIERFNAYTGYIFGVLYERFPVARGFDEVEIARDLTLPPQIVGKGQDALSEEGKLVLHTLTWLVETGYLIRRVEASGTTRYVLAPKALEALNATVSALEGKKPQPEEQTVGAKLAEVASGTGKELAKEARKQLVTQMVGQVIGYAVKAFTSPT